MELLTSKSDVFSEKREASSQPVYRHTGSDASLVWEDLTSIGW